MGFEDPPLLLGLAGMAIPIVIHYHLRRSAPAVPMDAVLVLCGDRTMVRLRLIHVLLLLCRVFIAGLLAVLFARPYVETRAVTNATAERPVTMAIVLDTSMSMRYGRGTDTNWTRAKTQVQKVLRELPPGSSVHLILAGRAPIYVSDIGSSPYAVSSYISKLAPTVGGSDLGVAIRTAARILRQSEREDRHMVVVSDFLDHSFRSKIDEEELSGIATTLLDVAADGPLANRAVVETTAVAAPDAGPNHIKVSATILNDRDMFFDEVVTARIGETRVARRLTCNPHSRCAVEFLLVQPPGEQWGEIRLSPDSLPDDDQRFFPLSNRDQDAVLVVNGAPGRLERDDEVFFLSRALSARVSDTGGFSITVVRPEDLSPLHLSAVGTVVLANVARLLPEQVQALVTFVASGHGLLITFGDNALIERGASLVPDILPAGVRDVVDFRGYGVRRWGLTSDHPALEGLLHGPGSLSSVLVERYTVLDAPWAQGTRVIARLDNGAPVLIERELGKGVILILLTSIDRDWSDLPLRPVFAPLVKQVFVWLKRLGETGGKASIEVGDPRHIEVPLEFEAAMVNTPTGEVVRLNATREFTNTAVPGAYRVDYYSPGRATPARREVFVVNPPSWESALGRNNGIPMALRAAPGGKRMTSDDMIRKVSLGPFFLLAILILLFGEAYLRGKA